ncbi:MAG TPA: universal stress protein [Cyanobacteria bacterium UBA8553]|nr:universal stress protein [Cyanobacteria bacterium UBA8553]
MFHKMLVAIDNSKMSKYVFDEALYLAKSTNACLMLLHVLSPYEQGYPVMPALSSLVYYPKMQDEAVKAYLEEWETYKEQGLERLRSLAAKATALGVSTEFTQTPGTPGYAICDLACSWGADLIIIGRRGRLGLSEAILGSVSNYVTHHACCSVLTVLPQVNTETEILEEDRAAGCS